MNIVQVNTYDIQGGAARAAYRLHKGLLLLGQNSTLLSRYKVSSDRTVKKVISETIQDNIQSLSLATVQSHYIDNNRTRLTNTLFSLSYPGFDLSQYEQVLAADIINLHWVAFFQSPVTLKSLLSLGKPVVWTLHDMWAFTGGCHYSAGCEKYQEDCSNCPQLLDDSYQLARAVLADKIDFFADANLTIVTPSRWLTDCVRKSRLFKNNRVETIPYSLETEDIFVPVEKPKAKQFFGIQPDTITLLFGAGTATEARKGFAQLVEAIQHCLENSQFQALVSEKRVEILCFGYPSELIHSLGIPVRSLGSIESDFRLSEAYSAADLFILPSLEDNLPNTMLEAMSCGTPVIGFDTGGIPDLVEDHVTGRLVPLRDTQRLAEAILDCIFDPDLRQRMSLNCRQLLETKYSIKIQAERYLELYHGLIGNHSNQYLTDQTDSNQSIRNHSPMSFEDHSNPSISAPVSSLGKESTKILDAITHQAFIAKLQQTEAFLAQVKSDLVETQTKLSNTQSQLTQTQTDLEIARKGWTENQRVLEQVQAELVHEKQCTEPLKAMVESKKQIISQLQEQLQAIETVRSQTIQTLSASNEHLKHRFQELNQSVKKLRQENQELTQSLGQTKEHLEQEIAYLSTGKAAIRKLFKVLLRKLRIYNFVYDNYKIFVPVYNLFLRDKWKPATVTEAVAESPTTSQPTSPSPKPAKAKPITPKSSEIDMESPLIQALITARQLGDASGEIQLERLEWLSDLATQTRHVLCVQPSHEIVPLLQLLKQNGASVTCVDCQGNRSALQTYGFEAIAQDLSKWMLRTNRNHFHDFDLICVSHQLPSETLLLFKGRLSPKTQIIVDQIAVNAADSAQPATHTSTTHQTHDAIIAS